MVLFRQSEPIKKPPFREMSDCPSRVAHAHDFRRLSAKLTGILPSAGGSSPNQLPVGSFPPVGANKKNLPFGRFSLAPTVGFEPTTNRLTADCSTAELSRNNLEAGTGIEPI